MTDSGIPEVKPSVTTNGHFSETLKNSTPTTSSSTTRSSPLWDEDWISNKSTLHFSTTNMPSSQPPITNQPMQFTNSNSRTSIPSAESGHQTPLSCPPVDVEWPPRSSSSATPQLTSNEKQNQNQNGAKSTLDDFDPFADWPPQPTGGSASVSRPFSNGPIAPPINNNGSSFNSSIQNGLNFQANNASWAFSTHNSAEPLRQNQGNSALNSDSYGNSAWSTSNQKATDIGSIFSTSKNEKTPLRLAPPPSSTAVGRGRGRGRGNQGQAGARSSRTKSSSEQPPLLDLL